MCMCVLCMCMYMHGSTEFGFEHVESEVPERLFGGCNQEAVGPWRRIRLEKKKIFWKSSTHSK